jgi:O-antigen/teichoic acid export membrane protein
VHGAFLLTSIGIGIEKKTRYYPLVTASAAASNLGLNLLLIPRYGMLGAAWATVFSYGVMAGLGYALSQRVYPIPFEKGRLARIALAALAVYAVATLAPAALLPALAVKTLALAAFPVLLLVSGFLGPEERAWLGRRLSRG